MSEIKHVLEEQLEREKNSALKQLTTSNLDAMYKITTTLCNLEKMEHGDIAETVMDAGENLIKKYSNGKYDKNIDALYDNYLSAKMAYKENGDQGHRDKLMESVGRLMVEVYDMLSSMVIDSDFMDERNTATDKETCGNVKKEGIETAYFRVYNKYVGIMQICHSLLVSTEFFKRFWLHDNRKRVRGSSGVQVPTFLLP